MKKFIIIALVSTVLITGCSLFNTKTAYKTLGTIETATSFSYDGYVDSILAGISTTNYLPQVSSKFNQFQAGFIVALDAVEYNTNALAPVNLVVESDDIINFINQIKGK